MSKALLEQNNIEIVLFETEDKEVQLEGDREVERSIEHYSLDMIISVGYRVKSSRGVEFLAMVKKSLAMEL